MHLAAPCAGQLLPLAAVPPFAHVHCLVAHSRFCAFDATTVSYCASVHVSHATQAWLLRWKAPLHDMHLAAPCVGQLLPLAAVPPFAHVHCFVAHWRFIVLLGATVWYSAPVHVVHETHALLLR